MAHPHATDALAELTARGLIRAEPPPRELPRGNRDRRNGNERSAWIIHLSDGRRAKLALGPALGDVAKRHAAFAAECPALVPALLFIERVASGDALAEEFFDGFSLEAAVREDQLPPDLLRTAVDRLGALLAATERVSDESARQAEWQAWVDRLTGLAVWQPQEVDLLRDLLLPKLHARLADTPPVTRWSNGDFLASNILVDSTGEARLIDMEFATRTHFFVEDQVRFHALSPAVRHRSQQWSSRGGDAGLAWHLYFWLRQLQLEVENNTLGYLARILPLRLGAIRRLAEMVLKISLDGWSTKSLVVHHGLEEARWLQDPGMGARLTGWCHVPAAAELQQIVALSGGQCVARARPDVRSDVQQYFNGDTRALLSGFTLTTQSSGNEADFTLCVLIDDGALLPFHAIAAAELPKGVPLWEDYATWAAANDPDPPAPAASPHPAGPLFSILLPVYNTPPHFLRACIESVLAQHHPRWELCVVDDGSTVREVVVMLQEFARADPRIHLHTRAQNGGISRASNDALALAGGEFVVLLDHDDVLRPHALAEFARRLEREPALDVLYSDEDKITADGRRVIPFLKPAFSPEFVLRVMYVGHALCVRTTIARAAGGFDPVHDGVQDYEFFLRVTRHTQRIGHVPRMLYHWRQSPTSSALYGNIKGNIDEKQAAAVRAHLQRLGRTEQVVASGGHRVRLYATETHSTDVIRPDNGLDIIERLRRAARSSHAEIIVMLAAEPLSTGEHWLTELAALAAKPDSGCIAPLLLSREGRVLESGWTVGPLGTLPMMRGFESDADGYNGSLCCCREVLAVSSLCFAIRRDTLAGLLSSSPARETWLEFSARVHGSGRFHRVCATASVTMDSSWRDVPLTEGAWPGGSVDLFLNRHFDPQRADYRLRTLARPSFQWHLDTDTPESAATGCIIWRGWCFAGDAVVSAIRLRAADRMLHGVVGLPRPDVRAELPEAPDDNTGFEIRGTLPPGRLALCLEAMTGDGSWHELTTHRVNVHRQWVPLWLGGGAWTELMFFQMPAHMAHPPQRLRPEQFPPAGTRSRARFSIVTPSFQQARFLGETMRSVLGQTGIQCDYVVQDGGSTDGSPDIIRRFAAHHAPSSAGTDNPGSASAPQPQLTAWASEPDHGQADAIMRGFAQTAGGPDDLMAWINSDDFYLPGALAFVADYFARHPEIDVVYGHRIVVNEDSQEIARWFLPRHDDTVLRLNDFVPQETVFWRRRIWDEVGGLDSEFTFAMDWDLLLRFADAGAKIARVPFFLACFRVHPAQKTLAMMHDRGRKEIDLLRSRANAREFPAHELEQHPVLMRYLRRSAFIQFLWRLGIRAA